MDSRLFMEIGINESGNFYAVDRSPYTTWIEEYEEDIDHYVFQWLIELNDSDPDSEGELVQAIQHTPAHSLAELQAPYEVKLERDGLYHYFKMIIPTKDHMGQSTCYADDNGIYTLDENGNAVEINYAEAWDLVNDVTTGNAFWFDDFAFSIYNLIKCYVLTEKQRISEWLKNNCKADCSKYSTNDTNAEILMAAVTVLRYLIANRQFVDAFRILNGLQTCGSLCRDHRSNLKGCGCGKSIY